MGAVSGDVNTLSTHCTNAADLASRPVAGLKTGDMAYVESFRCWFVLDRTSTASANGVTIIATPSGNLISTTGRWFRVEDIFDPAWQSQAAWFINPATGSDENTGATALTAIQTWAEFRRRIKTLTQDTTVTILGNMAEPIIGEFSGQLTALGGAPVLMIVGTPTVVASGTVLVAANPVPAGNAEGTLTSAAIAAWQFGGIVEADDGAGVLTWAPVMADVAGTAQTPFWASATGFGILAHTLPLAGQAIRVLNGSTVDRINLASASPLEVLFRFRYLDLTGGPSSVDGFCQFEACQINGGFGNYGSDQGTTTFVGCAILGGGDVDAHSPYGVLFFGGAALNALSFATNAYARFDGFVSYGTLTFGAAGGNVNGWSAAQIVAGGAGLGVFNGATGGIVVTRGARLDVPNTAGALYGDGNVGIGVNATDGGIVSIDTITPTITATVQQIAVDGQATCVPPLTAADAAVPAAAALATWAQWAAAPFNRVGVNYAFTAAGVGAASMARIIGT